MIGIYFLSYDIIARCHSFYAS